jgi:hypothetical protein
VRPWASKQARKWVSGHLSNSSSIIVLGNGTGNGEGGGGGEPHGWDL